MDDIRRDRYSAVYSKAQSKYYEFNSSYNNQAAYFEPSSVEENIPKYLDYLYFLDYMRGWNSSILTNNFDVNLAKQYYKLHEDNGKPLQVNGNEYAVYLFDLGSINTPVKRVQVEITIKNDYNIQVAQINTKKVDGGHDKVGDNYKHYTAEYWSTMAQADGNIKDGSNLRTLKIDFGYEVGNMVYGINADFNYFGLRINGEFVNNTHYYYFADNIPGTGLPATPPDDINPRKGHRSSISDNAYYITLEKNMQK